MSLGTLKSAARAGHTNLDENNLGAFQSNGGCDRRLDTINASSGSLNIDQVWPKKNNDLPSGNTLFRINREEFSTLQSVDTIPTETDNIRIWAFDDSPDISQDYIIENEDDVNSPIEGSIKASVLPCGDMVCTRPARDAKQYRNYQYSPEQQPINTSTPKSK